MTIFRKQYKKSRFRVKKPIRSFRDLEVYQRASQYATEVMKTLIPLVEEGSPVKDKLVNTCLNIPEAIAEGHSRRFEVRGETGRLEGALEGCNRAVVYIELVRDIYIKDTDGRAVCEDLVKRYILLRRKTFNLQKAWERFGGEVK